MKLNMNPWGPRGQEREDQDERGSMLIVALGILALLSILAITFVKLMNLEQKATTNYVDMVKARLIAEGGLERTMAQLKLSISAEQFSDPNAAWIYAKGDYSLPLEEAVTDRTKAKRASFSGLLGASYSDGKDQYKVKVLDTQTQFNLNSKFELSDTQTEGKLDLTYIRWLDALGVAISKLNPRARSGTARTGVNPIANARYPRGSPNAKKGGKAIYLFRQSRENNEFKSKSELMEVLASEDDYKLLKDYVTSKSWFDPKTVSPRAADKLHTKPWSDVIEREKRSPININLASEECIAANIAGIAGRAIYVWTGNITTQGVDQQSTNYAFTQKQEEKSYTSQGVVVYLDPFGYQPGQRPDDPPWVTGALKLARSIRVHIDNQGPFQSFADWEAFVDKTLTDGYIENSRDPDNGNNRVYPYWASAKITDLRGQSLTGGVTPAAIRSEPRFRYWFNNAVRSMLKANFNPNPRLSGWNPDPVVYLPVDKGGLMWRDPSLTNDADPNKHLHMRQTLEWCLAPKGVFEITSLGEVLGPPPKDIKKARDIDGDGVRDADAEEIFAQAKVRGILQLYDTVVLRSQRDFEALGDRYRDGTAQRDEMISYPVPKIYWDPAVNGTSGLKDFYSLWNAQGLLPSKTVGHIQLSTRRKGDPADVFHSQVVPMGLASPSAPPRFEVLFQDRRSEVPSSNRVDIADVLQADTSNGEMNNPRPGKPVTGRCKNPWGWPYGDARQGIFPVARPSDLQEAWRWNVLVPDGYLNSMLRPSLLWYRASDSFKNKDGSSETFAAAGGAELSPNRRGWSNVHVVPTIDKDTNSNYTESTNPDETKGNVAATPIGAVEFWYKPTFDWVQRRWTGTRSQPTKNPPDMDQRFCGLLSTSHVLLNKRGFTHAGASSAGVFSRGTQMFVTRNTFGELRITRLYYEVCGRQNGSFEVPYVNDPVAGSKISLSKYYEFCRTNPQYVWPPVELLMDIPGAFQDIRWARSDYWLPASLFQNWVRGEWHHIAFRWEDRGNITPLPPKYRRSMQVWIDGKGPFDPVANQIGSQQGTPGYPGYIPVGSYDTNGNPVPPLPPAPQKLPLFVRLNMQSYNPSQGEPAERPKDMITVGSVWRDQVKKDDGVFKHTADGRINLPANGTMDDVRFYDGSPTISDPTPNIEYEGRYVQKGVWTGEIDLTSVFPDSGALTLSAMNFVAYLPKQYGPVSANLAEKAQGAGSVEVKFDVLDSAGTPVTRYSATDRATWVSVFNSNVASGTSKTGFPIRSFPPGGGGGAPITVNKGERLVYTVTIDSAKYDDAQGLNTTTGSSVASPVLDELSLVYFLPSSKVLLKERVNN